MIQSKVSKLGMPYLHFGVGEPLVLIHGLGEIKEGWVNQFELADQYELFIPDLRGHGEHDLNKEISISLFATDIIQMLTENSIESANIMGLSMGGAVAQEIFRQAPDKCRSLILASTFHYFPKQLAPLFLKYRKNKVKKLASHQTKQSAAELALYSWNQDGLDEFEDHFHPKQESFIKSLQACLNVNNLKLLRKINVPTLVISGQYDAVIPVWIQVWMHKLMPHSEFIIMRNTGHVAKLEAKDRFNTLVRDFLSRNGTLSEPLEKQNII
ncbi:alpha/beta hydrolase [Mesobacillus maritimus]|uniref:alpha/beta fold hydrolase n=1 Tax=Mesobacillus maritimus TaxID=1643336 RepID=UPI002040F242|nr:alpha/beta hydrolase [Mesobacillus maritimus]MCM3585878.1 alpha/beta hydrolase [Mesobacillus maritimus]